MTRTSESVWVVLYVRGNFANPVCAFDDSNSATNMARKLDGEALPPAPGAGHGHHMVKTIGLIRARAGNA